MTIAVLKFLLSILRAEYETLAVGELGHKRTMIGRKIIFVAIAYGRVDLVIKEGYSENPLAQWGKTVRAVRMGTALRRLDATKGRLFGLSYVRDGRELHGIGAVVWISSRILDFW